MRHGTNTGYRNGCRCDGCKQAQSKANREYRERNKKVNEIDGRGKWRRYPVIDFAMSVPVRDCRKKRVLVLRSKKVESGKPIVRLGNIETMIDIMRFIRYSSSPVSTFSLRKDVTDHSACKVKNMLNQLSLEGYIDQICGGVRCKYIATEKLKNLF